MNIMKCITVLFLLLPQPTYGIMQHTVGGADDAGDQTKYGHCVFYAYSHFLQIWGDQRNTVDITALDPSYFAITDNLEGLGNADGTYIKWAWAYIAKYGALPLRAEIESDDLVWPVANWRTTRRDGFFDYNMTAPLASARYSHANVSGPFSPNDYLDDIVKIEMKDFLYVSSKHKEDFVTSSGASTQRYRYSTWAKTLERVKSIAKSEGLDFSDYSLEADKLYDGILKQLYKDRPVIARLNSGLIDGASKKRTVGTADLKAKGKRSPHAVTIVGHCDQWETDDTYCKAFASEMKSKNITECIMIQNSWGKDAHNNGYFCLSKQASRRVLSGALLLKSAVNGSISI